MQVKSMLAIKADEEVPWFHVTFCITLTERVHKFTLETRPDCIASYRIASAVRPPYSLYTKRLSHVKVCLKTKNP